jgi:hypothetical protein
MPPETGRSSRPSPPDDRLLGLRLRRPPQVISRQVGEWLMLIDVDTGFTYEANWLGAEVWRLLVEGRSVDDACRVLVGLNPKSRDTIEKDVAAFVRDLLGYGLVSAESSTSASPSSPSRSSDGGALPPALLR